MTLDTSTTATTADVRTSTGRLDTEAARTLESHARAGGSVLLVPEPGDDLAAALAGAASR